MEAASPSPRSQLSAAAEHLQCGVCWETLRDPCSLACGHSFCSVCMQEWLQRGAGPVTCPSCRSPITGGLPGVNVTLRKVIADLSVPPSPQRSAAAQALQAASAQQDPTSLLAAVAANFDQSAPIRLSVILSAEPSYRALLLLLRCHWQCEEVEEAEACAAAVRACALSLWEGAAAPLCAAALTLAAVGLHHVLHRLGGLRCLAIGALLQGYLHAIGRRLPLQQAAGALLLAGACAAAGAWAVQPLWAHSAAALLVLRCAAAAAAILLPLYVCLGLDHLLLPRQLSPLGSTAAAAGLGLWGARLALHAVSCTSLAQMAAPQSLLLLAQVSAPLALLCTQPSSSNRAVALAEGCIKGAVLVGVVGEGLSAVKGGALLRSAAAAAAEQLTGPALTVACTAAAAYAVRLATGVNLLRRRLRGGWQWLLLNGACAVGAALPGLLGRHHTAGYMLALTVAACTETEPRGEGERERVEGMDRGVLWGAAGLYAVLGVMAALGITSVFALAELVGRLVLGAAGAGVLVAGLWSLVWCANGCR